MEHDYCKHERLIDVTERCNSYITELCMDCGEKFNYAREYETPGEDKCFRMPMPRIEYGGCIVDIKRISQCEF